MDSLIEKAATLSLDNQVSEEFKLIAHVEDLNVYSKPGEVSNSFHYYVDGTINTSLVHAIEVYKDLDFRKQWDSYTHKTARLACVVGNQEIFYWPVKYHFYKNREYYFSRESKVEKNVFVSISKTYTMIEEPIVYQRVVDFESKLIIREDSENPEKCEIYFEYFDNPLGSFPEALRLRAIKTFASSFVAALKKEHRSHTDHKAAQELQKVLDASMIDAFNVQ